MDTRAVRSPEGQKLISDLLTNYEEDTGFILEEEEEDGDLAAGVLSPSAVSPKSSASRKRSKVLGSAAPGPTRRVPGRPVASAVSPSLHTASRLPTAGAAGERPSTAPPLILPAQLPAARGHTDAWVRPAAAALGPPSPLHHPPRPHVTGIYTGTVTAVLHAVGSPAATGEPIEARARPGRVPSDVYLHSTLHPPPRTPPAEGSPSSRPASPTRAPWSPGGSSEPMSYDRASPSLSHPSDFHSYAPSPDILASPSSPASRRPHSSSLIPGSAAGSPLPSPAAWPAPGSAPTGAARSRLAGDRPGSVPFLDRASASKPSLAVTLDAVARRAEAHKALTRQRLLEQQQKQHRPHSGGAAQQQGPGSHWRHAAPLATPHGGLYLAQDSNLDPYTLKAQPFVHPASLGLAWEASPGAVAAAASAAAAAAAAAAATGARHDSTGHWFPKPGSPALGTGLRPADGDGGAADSTTASALGMSGWAEGGGVGYNGSPSWSPKGLSSGGPGRRRRALPAWGSPLTAPGQGRPPTTPAAAVAAAATASSVVAAAASYLPPAVRRGYGGSLAAQTVQDWENILEPNRRMMQAIDNVTNLVAPPTRRATVARSQSQGQRSGLGAAAEASSASSLPGVSTPYGSHTSARSRRRYIRYSMDILPELGLDMQHARHRAGEAGGAGGASARGPLRFGLAAAERVGGGEGLSLGLRGVSAAPSEAADSRAGSEDEDEDEGEARAEDGGGASPTGQSSHSPAHAHHAVHAPVPNAPLASLATAGDSPAAAAAALLPHWVDNAAAAHASSHRGGAGGSVGGHPAGIVVTLTPPVTAGGTSTHQPPAFRGFQARGTGLTGYQLPHPHTPATTPSYGAAAYREWVDDDEGGASSGGWSGGGAAGAFNRKRTGTGDGASLQVEHSFGMGLFSSGSPAGSAAQLEALSDVVLSAAGAGPSATHGSASTGAGAAAGSADGGGRAAVPHLPELQFGRTHGSAGQSSPPSVEPSLTLLPAGMASSMASVSYGGELYGGASSASTSTAAAETGAGAEEGAGPVAARNAPDAGSHGAGAGHGTEPESHASGHIAYTFTLPPRVEHTVSPQQLSPSPQHGQSPEAGGAGARASQEGSVAGTAGPHAPSSMAVQAESFGSSGAVPVTVGAHRGSLGEEASGHRLGPHSASSLLEAEASLGAASHASSGASHTLPLVGGPTHAGGRGTASGLVVAPSSSSSTMAAATLDREPEPSTPVSETTEQPEAAGSVAAAATAIAAAAAATAAATAAAAAATTAAAAAAATAAATAAAAAATAPQGPVHTPGAGYRLVTSVAAAVASEDGAARSGAAAQAQMDALLAAEARAAEHDYKVRAAGRATKALSRGGAAHPSSQSLGLASPRATTSTGSGASLSPPRSVRAATDTGGPPGGAGVQLVSAPAADERLAALAASGARALLAAAPVSLAARISPPSLRPQGQREVSTAPPPSHAHAHAAAAAAAPRRPLPPAPSSTPASPVSGSYQHVQAATVTGRTAQMQDVWAA